MTRFLFISEDNLHQMTVVTDGIDSHLNVFVSETVVGDVDYFAKLGLVIEVGHTYNIGMWMKWARVNRSTLIEYPEGLFDQARILEDKGQEISYEYTLTLDDPASPIVFKNTGDSVECKITSTRQKIVDGQLDGQPENVPVIATIEGMGFYISDFKGVISALENPRDQVRKGKLKIQQAMIDNGILIDPKGKTIEIDLEQEASVITYEYDFSVRNDLSELEFQAIGETKEVFLESTKQTYLNGKAVGDAENVSYTTQLEGDGFTASSDNKLMNCYIVATENRGDARSGKITFKQNGSLKTVEITLTQEEGQVTYKYSLSVSPEEVTFEAAGGTEILEVFSEKQKYINGTLDGDPVSVDYTTEVEGEGFSKGSTEYSVVAAANTGNERTGLATIIAEEGDEVVVVELSQAAGN